MGVYKRIRHQPHEPQHGPTRLKSHQDGHPFRRKSGASALQWKPLACRAVAATGTKVNKPRIFLLLVLVCHGFLIFGIECRRSRFLMA